MAAPTAITMHMFDLTTVVVIIVMHLLYLEETIMAIHLARASLIWWNPLTHIRIVERSGSGVELRTLDYENPGSNPGCGVKTLGKFFHSTLLQFTQLNKNELAIDSGGYVYEQPSRINCSIWLDASQRSRDGVWVNMTVREEKCKALWAILRTGYCAI